MTHKFIVQRTYETIVEIEAENIQEALEQLSKTDIYAIEMEQCCVVEETLTDEEGNKIEY